MGPSGVGKTSIINAIKGHLEFEGSLRIDGVEVTPSKVKEYRIGFVPQEDTMDSELTPREVLTYD